MPHSKMTFPGSPQHSRGPSGVKAALCAPHSRSQSLDTGLPASAYSPNYPGMSDELHGEFSASVRDAM